MQRYIQNIYLGTRAITCLPTFNGWMDESLVLLTKRGVVISQIDGSHLDVSCLNGIKHIYWTGWKSSLFSLEKIGSIGQFFLPHPRTAPTHTRVQLLCVAHMWRKYEGQKNDACVHLSSITLNQWCVRFLEVCPWFMVYMLHIPLYCLAYGYLSYFIFL